MHSIRRMDVWYLVALIEIIQHPAKATINEVGIGSPEWRFAAPVEVVADFVIDCYTSGCRIMNKAADCNLRLCFLP